MRVLVAGRYGGANGIETYTRFLTRGLVEAGLDVAVADRSGGRLGEDATGCRLESLPPPRPRVRQLLGPFENTLYHPRLRRLAEAAGADIIHATRCDFVPAGGPPAVVTAWSPFVAPLPRALSARSRAERPWPEALFAANDRVALRRAADIVAISTEVERALTAGGHSPTRIPPFLPDDQVTAPRRHRTPSCVMIAGVLDSPRKGLDVAVDAVRRVRSEIPGVRLVLVGAWSDRSVAGRLPAFCDPVGPLRSAAVRGLLLRSGCCLLPSVWEEFGYVGLEALAAGVPVVCGPLPGLVGLETDGIVVASQRHPESFAAALCAALRLPGFSFPDECRQSHALPRIIDLYARALHRSGRATGPRCAGAGRTGPR